jgi:5-methyltetrahydrofolate--homocysteine methyltransferase
MQLPFVLQSAETMKAAVAILEPFMERVAGQEKGIMVLATVKGDVHDIGKNLVDIILTNNGYKVINLGIKQPLQNIIDAAKANNADAIGMSGLLVKSTVIMRENLEEMKRLGICTPVILGGAALTRRYVETDCRASYTVSENVHYAKDAFAGLRLMDEIVTVKAQGL